MSILEQALRWVVLGSVLIDPHVFTLCLRPHTDSKSYRLHYGSLLIVYDNLRRLNHYTRASMTGERLSSLVLIHIHYDYNHSVDDIVDKFARMHPRKMELAIQ